MLTRWNNWKRRGPAPVVTSASTGLTTVVSGAFLDEAVRVSDEALYDGLGLRADVVEQWQQQPAGTVQTLVVSDGLLRLERVAAEGV